MPGELILIVEDNERNLKLVRDLLRRSARPSSESLGYDDSGRAPGRPGMAIPQRRMTLEKFLSLPEEKPALEYIDGRVTQKVSPKGPHARLQTVLSRLFDDHAGSRKLGMAFSEARVTFGGDSLVPDLVFYRWDRIPHTPTGRIAEDFTTPPDLVIEIISPGQRLNALMARCRWYVDHGVPLVLLVDPRRERVMLFRAGAEPSLVSGDEAIDLQDVLPGLLLTARQLFEALYVR